MTPKQRAMLEALRDGQPTTSVASGSGATRIFKTLLADGLVTWAPVTHSVKRPDGSTYEYRTSRRVITDAGRAAVSS